MKRDVQLQCIRSIMPDDNFLLAELQNLPGYNQITANVCEILISIRDDLNCLDLSSMYIFVWGYFKSKVNPIKLFWNHCDGAFIRNGSYHRVYLLSRHKKFYCSIKWVPRCQNVFDKRTFFKKIDPLTKHSFEIRCILCLIIL